MTSVKPKPGGPAGKPAGERAANPGPAKAPPKKKRPATRRLGRGALGIISGLLVAAGLIRIGDGIGKVMALETVSAASAATKASPGECTPDGGTAALLKALQGREAALAQNEAAIADRRQALGIVEARIKDRLAELVAAEDALAATLSHADKASEEDLARLTSVYENMKPKEAALLFTEMEPDFAAGFLARMRPEAAAGVMAGLEPKTAYAISAVFAGRNATVPKN